MRKYVFDSNETGYDSKEMAETQLTEVESPIDVCAAAYLH